MLVKPGIPAALLLNRPLARGLFLLAYSEQREGVEVKEFAGE